jgi:putative hydrolase of the HAD superfamily
LTGSSRRPTPPGRRDRADALVVDVEIAGELLALVREVRAVGRPVVLAARPPAAPELAAEFDAVLDSTVDGSHKPTRAFFAIACEAVGRVPGRCLFVDADDRSVRGARVAGLSAYRWNGPADLPYLRAALDLPPPD